MVPCVAVPGLCWVRLVHLCNAGCQNTSTKFPSGCILHEAELRLMLSMFHFIPNFSILRFPVVARHPKMTCSFIPLREQLLRVLGAAAEGKWQHYLSGGRGDLWGGTLVCVKITSVAWLLMLGETLAAWAASRNTELLLMTVSSLKQIK